MSPLVRKEIRLILPFWGVAVLLAVLPSFTPRDSYVTGVEEYIYLAFGFGVMLLGLAPFGQEFSLGTFSCLLAQPCERRRIWRLKILFVTIAGLVVLVAFALSIHARMDANLQEALQRLLPAHRLDAEVVARKWRADEFRSACRMAFVLLLVAVTGGFWTTLLFRQTGAALWFVILIPGLLYVVEGIFQSVSGLALSMTAILTLYSAIGFFWAHRLFTTAQDSQWLGEAVGMLSLKPARAQADTTAPHRQGALRALIRKEFQSNQIGLFVAFGLLMLHVCTLVFRRFETLPKNSELRFAIAAVPFLWLFIPWLIGSLAVAEERKLGTIESQLCLPVNRRLQFAVKLTVTLLLGITLGGVMPCLLEALGNLAGISSQIVTSISAPGGTTYFATMLEVVLGAGFIVVISLFASSLTRNTLHALGGAVVFGGAFFGLYQWLIFESIHYEYSLWKGPLILVIGVPVAFAAVVRLSFSNYKRLHAGQNVWLRNLLILSATLAISGIATAFVYQRPWELAMSREPRHGAPRLSGSVRPALFTPNGRVVALLPDGRLWVAVKHRWQDVSEYKEVVGSTNVVRKITVPAPTAGVFVGGSNWVVLAAHRQIDVGDVIALQSDGTLWTVLSQSGKTNSGSWEAQLAEEPKLRRIGSDSNWKTVASAQSGFLAIKSDGTLWGWGPSPFGTNFGKLVPEPVRVGTRSDWETIFPEEYGALLMKRDGSISVAFTAEPMNLNGSDWLDVGGANDCLLVIRRNGSLWIRARGYRSNRLFGGNNPGWNTAELARFGGDSDWGQVVGFPPDFVAIKGGRLLKNSTTLFANALGKPSKNSDWLAVGDYWNRLTALSADGTLSMWQDAGGVTQSHMLFAPTHRPLWTFNIFTDSKN